MSVECKLVKYYGDECTKIIVPRKCSMYVDILIENVRKHFRCIYGHSLIAHRKTLQYDYYYFKGNILEYCNELNLEKW